MPLKSTTEERFWAKVDRRGPDECWPWLAYHDHHGYASFRFQGHMRPAYRYAYLLLHGSIPAGLELDHLCRNRGCVNSAHLEAITHRENLLRGVGVPARNAARTHCPKGHSYDLLNTINTSQRKSGGRRCRACGRERDKVRRLATARITVRATYRRVRDEYRTI